MKRREISLPRGRGRVGTVITIFVTVGSFIWGLLPVPAPRPRPTDELRFRVLPPPIIIGDREIQPVPPPKPGPFLVVIQNTGEELRLLPDRLSGSTAACKDGCK